MVAVVAVLAALTACTAEAEPPSTEMIETVTVEASVVGAPIDNAMACEYVHQAAGRPSDSASQGVLLEKALEVVDPESLDLLDAISEADFLISESGYPAPSGAPDPAMDRAVAECLDLGY